jgi:hypothetical protein
LFFKSIEKGRKTTKKVIGAKDIVLDLRKSYHSVEEIKAIIDGKGFNISEWTIYDVVKREGFSRLLRRTKLIKINSDYPKYRSTKAAWYTSYSHRVTSDMNLKFLKSLHKICNNSPKGNNIVDRFEQISAKLKKTIRVEMAGNKKRSLTALDEEIYLKG